MTKHSPPKTAQEITAFDRTQCQALWHHLFKTNMPRHLSLTIARPVLAFECQARRSRGLDRHTKTSIKAAMSPSHKPGKGRLAPGTSLLRDWNGTQHKVDVTGDGFIWQGQRFRSLSAVAYAITGARWSGPRFFGLKASS